MELKTKCDYSPRPFAHFAFIDGENMLILFFIVLILGVQCFCFFSKNLFHLEKSSQKDRFVCFKTSNRPVLFTEQLIYVVFKMIQV